MQYLLFIHSFLFYKTFALKIGRLGYFDYRFSIVDYNLKVEAHHMVIAKVAFVPFLVMMMNSSHILSLTQ